MSNPDDFNLIDAIQRDANRAIDELLPFEPDEEVRKDTAIEEPVEALPADEQAEVSDDDIIDPLAGLDLDSLEGFDD